MSAADRTFAGSWVVGGATVRGAAHERRGAPNQDAVGWRPLGGAGPQVTAAVADGHGAAAHFRSDVGARLAVESANAVLDGFLSHGEREVARLPGEAVAAWRAAVREHAAAEAEGWIEPMADTLLPYGATLLALAAADAVSVLQIGDGDIVLGFPDGTLDRPLPDDAGLRGEQTHSLCTGDAADRFRFARFGEDGATPDFAFLSTDGVGKSFGCEAGLRDVAGQFRQALLRAPMDEVMRSLPGWLSELSRRGSGDDATVCLAIRRPRREAS